MLLKLSNIPEEYRTLERMDTPVLLLARRVYDLKDRIHRWEAAETLRPDLRALAAEAYALYEEKGCPNVFDPELVEKRGMPVSAQFFENIHVLEDFVATVR
jgi:hypothetical protein